MKQLLSILCLLAICTVTQAQSRVKFGIKGGLSAPSGSMGSFSVNHADSSFLLGLKKAKYGIQVGAWARFGKKLFIQPELYFNSNSSDYELEGMNFQTVVKNEKYQYLDLPVLAGVKLGPLTLQGGPVGHYFLNSKSELIDVQGYSQMFEQFTWGYQAGAGLEFSRIGLDVRYEGTFSNQNNHMQFFGQTYQFDQSPARIVAALRVQLF